jgi:hypothetical protein
MQRSGALARRPATAGWSEFLCGRSQRRSCVNAVRSRGMACADCGSALHVCPQHHSFKSRRRAMLVISLKSGWLRLIDGCGYEPWPAKFVSVVSQIACLPVVDQPTCRVLSSHVQQFFVLSNRTTRCLVLPLRASKPAPRPNCGSLTEIRPRAYRWRMPRGALLPGSERQLAQRVWPERLDPSSAGVTE